jgi:hypothetical protein
MGPVAKVVSGGASSVVGLDKRQVHQSAITSPSHQSSLSTRRITLDPVDGLSGQAGLLGNLSDTHGPLPQHGAHLSKLFAGEARLSAEVGTFVILLGVLDAGPLCGPQRRFLTSK